MSKFSEYLKKQIDASGEPISSIARSIGAERTSIHKALKDERILSVKTVHALAVHLQLSLEERQEFFRLYDILFQGEDLWRNCAAVCDLLNYLSDIHFPSVASDSQGYFSNRSFDPAFDYRLIEGEYSIQNTLYPLLSWEISQNPDAHFQLFLPIGMDFSSIFMRLWNDDVHFSMDQLFCFPSGVDNDCSQSVKALQQIIPLSLIARGFYRPYYFCEPPRSLSANPLSFYIVTPHYLILLSQNQSTALIHRSERLVNYFSNHFHILMEHCEPFVSFATTLPEILGVSSSMIDQNGSLCVMSQPCFGRYTTPEMISRYLQAGSGSVMELYDAIVNHFSLVQRVEKNFCSVFSEKGLRLFIETGRITEIPPDYVSAIHPEDRIAFLTQLRDDIASGKVIGRIARLSSLRIPDYLTLYIDTSGNAWLDTTADFIHGAYYCNIHISEKSIRHAFSDFLEALPDSQFVYSREETLHILDEGIRELEKL